ncbi:MAG: hypothetical protein ACK4TI_00710 [Nitrososphaerales archaeon]
MVVLTLLMRCVVVKPSPEASSRVDIMMQMLRDALPSFTDLKCSIQAKADVIEVDASDLVEVAETVSKFSGVAYAALAERVVPEFDTVLQTIVNVGKKGIFENERFTVKVEAPQNLNFEPKDLESLAISALIGEVSDRGAKPDEKKPNKVLYALLTKEDAYIFTHRFLGFGGLPCGSLGRCIILVEPTIRSLVNAWLTQRAGFDADYLVVNRPTCYPESLYRSFEVFALLRRCVPKKSVQLLYVNAAEQYTSGDVNLGYSWIDFTAALALEAARDIGVKAVSLPLNLDSSVKGVVERACREAINLFSPASFLTVDELLIYADKIGLLSKLTLDLEGNLGMLDASGRPVYDLDGAVKDAWKGVSKIEVVKGLLNAHEIVDRLS